MCLSVSNMNVGLPCLTVPQARPLGKNVDKKRTHSFHAMTQNRPTESPVLGIRNPKLMQSACSICHGVFFFFFSALISRLSSYLTQHH